MNYKFYVVKKTEAAGNCVNVCLHTDLDSVHTGAIVQNGLQYQPVCSHHSHHLFLFLLNHVNMDVCFTSASDRTVYIIIPIGNQGNFKEQSCYDYFGAYLVQFYYFLVSICTTLVITNTY